MLDIDFLINDKKILSLFESYSIYNILHNNDNHNNNKNNNVPSLCGT